MWASQHTKTLDQPWAMPKWSRHMPMAQHSRVEGACTRICTRHCIQVASAACSCSAHWPGTPCCACVPLSSFLLATASVRLLRTGTSKRQAANDVLLPARRGLGTSSLLPAAVREVHEHWPAQHRASTAQQRNATYMRFCSVNSPGLARFPSKKKISSTTEPLIS